MSVKCIVVEMSSSSSFALTKRDDNLLFWYMCLNPFAASCVMAHSGDQIPSSRFKFFIVGYCSFLWCSVSVVTVMVCGLFIGPRSVLRRRITVNVGLGFRRLLLLGFVRLRHIQRHHKDRSLRIIHETFKINIYKNLKFFYPISSFTITKKYLQQIL